MAKRNLLLTLMIAFAFIGAFFAVIFSTSSEEQAASAVTTIEKDLKSTHTDEQEASPSAASKNAKALIGYIQDFRNPNSIDYSNLTHAIFSFAHPTKNGDLLFSDETDLDNLKAMVGKAKETGTRVMLAVGGWSHINGGETYDYFKTAISEPSSRAKLVDEIMNIVELEDLDGIDIDFEHPRSTEDASSLTAFTKELGEQLHSKEKELSIAVHSKINAVTGTESDYAVYEPATFTYVDYVNIMAYDGQWDEGYHAENSAPYAFAEQVADYWSDFFDRHKLAKEKLVLGVPLYGQPADASSAPVSFATIIDQNPSNAQNDIITMNGTIYYYNGIETMKKKTKLALEHGFGGMMIWEAGLDAPGSGSIVSAIHEELERNRTLAVKEAAVN